MNKKNNLTGSMCQKLWIFGLFLITTGCSEFPGTGDDSDLLPIEAGILFTVKETHDQRHKVNDPVEPIYPAGFEYKGYLPTDV